MNTSNELDKLAAALCTAQANIGPAKMNAVNPFLKNRYADLAAIIDAVRHALADNGLSYVQMPATPPPGEFGIALTTRLLHSSGQWLEETFFMPMPADERGKSMMQVAGSAVTYARRYALAAMLGVVADEDADGNASPRGRKEKEEPPPRQQQPTPDTRGNMTPDAQASRDPRRKPPPEPEQIPDSAFRVGDDVLVKGKHDEKPGVVKEVNGLITVEVEGKTLKVSEDKLTLVELG